MNAVALQTAQNDVIRMVRETTDIHILDRIKGFLAQVKPYAQAEEQPVMAKEEIMDGLRDAFNELRLQREGKPVNLTNWEDFLNEL